MKHVLIRHAVSFKNALNGLFWAYRTQPNYLTHLTLSLLSVVGGLFFNITTYEWIAIIILITLGLVIETLNTAIEVTVDAIDTKWREDLKVAKDVAAAAMLTYAFGALVVAFIIFIPRLLLFF